MLEDKDISILDERYVRQKDCVKIREQNLHSIAQIEQSIALINKSLSIIKWLMGIVAATTVSEIVNRMLSLV